MCYIYIDSTDRGLIWSTVSPWLYQSRAVAKRRPETDLFHPYFIEICHGAIVYDIF